ncbi:MAG TPA: DUF808 domain-containing protein [Marmoricola sp.]|nr:DUF808 domain-containing protein [Marmoricola sp.]
MSGGLFGLLDDVAALAKLAAASVDDVGVAAGHATGKAAGVVIDDTAVTPQYVQGIAAERELPIIRKIAVGSLRNKILFILPVALVLSQFLPWLLTPILMLGGGYLCFEGAEKVWSALRGHGDQHGGPGARSEQEVVTGATRTDLILSAEIMVISLNEVADQGFWARLVILVAVAIAMTIAVYGVVALIVKMDDVGLHLAGRSTGAVGRLGHLLVTGMPVVLSVISVVGTAAMLWVGGHIELVGAKELGWHAPYGLVHHLQESVHHAVPGVGAALGWLVSSALSAVAGLLLGAVLVAVGRLLPRRAAPH